MRTTVDLDDTVLAAARSLARARGITLGAAISELARRGLQTPGCPPEAAAGSVIDVAYSPFPVLVGDDDVVVTDELVAEFRDG